MICDRIEKTGELHHVDLVNMKSFCDFEAGSCPEEYKSVSFIDNDKIYVIIDSASVYHHFFINLMIPALLVLDEYDHKDLYFVLCSFNRKTTAENFDNLLVELLQENNIGYTIVDSSEVRYINAKNFIPINGADVENGIPLLYNYLLNKYNVVPETPNRKIYLSRKKYSSNDNRIDDETAIENYFAKRGFEIFYPEDIQTFEEQFKLLNSCSTLAGLSGSGLTGIIFMQENQEVIELVTELLVGHTISEDNHPIPHYDIHEHYKEFAFIKNHTYLYVLNMPKEAAQIIDKLDRFQSSLGIKA
jgi:capsular polysaccharide biosynthesis protein